MEKLIAILNDLHPDIDFATTEGLIDLGILDSFDLVTLASEIDDEYGVQISADDLIPENFNSAAAIYSLIQHLSDI
jgi:acyl carrier protein